MTQLLDISFKRAFSRLVLNNNENETCTLIIFTNTSKDTQLMSHFIIYILDEYTFRWIIYYSRKWHLSTYQKSNTAQDLIKDEKVTADVAKKFPFLI